jgi:16S rRNA (cytosine1402-N4)-methyltransferase
MEPVNQHTTVLLEEAVAGLAIKANGIYIDGTFGRGGHAKYILENLGPDGTVFGIDKDPTAIAEGQAIQQQDNRLNMYQGSFATMKQLATEQAIDGKVDGVLLDLGVSSPQLDDATRGFSFLRDGPLDMRMNPDAGISAADWLNTAEHAEIADVIKRFGEERFGKRIAHAICERRVEQPIKTTFELVELIEQALPIKDKHKHPATRSFQGIRIFINQELADLEQALEQILSILAPGGRMSIISFHSLEDRMVKRFMKKHSKGDEYPSDFPIQDHLLNKKLKIVGKAIKPSEQELAVNRRSRSAVLRVAEKL